MPEEKMMTEAPETQDQNLMPDEHAMEHHHHSHASTWFLGALSVGLIVFIALAAVMITQRRDNLQTQADQARTHITDLESQLADANQMIAQEALNESGVQPSTPVLYDDGVVSFYYEPEWHVGGHRYYDNPDRTYPDFYYTVNPQPFVLVSPAGGVQRSEITISTLDDGEEYASIYGAVDGVDATEEDVVVNGVSAKEFSYIASGDIAYIPSQYQDIVIGNFVLSHIGDPNDVDWTQLQNTFTVKYQSPK